jgi:spore coat polysaccharide biosynthesis protein SpsF (cytidylyltransferase family)
LIGAVVQARMSSERLPGKVLRPLAGKPALQYVLERLERAREPDLVVVATSVDPGDDPIEELCGQLGVQVHRGPLENVAERFGEVAERFDLSAFARVTADSPLLDQRVVDRAVKLFREGNFDLVTNVFPSTFPSGQSVEVVARDAFGSAFAKMTDPDELEHVTLFFYRNPELFRIENFTAGHDDGDLDVSLDTVEDARLLEAMLARMEKPHTEYTSDELVELYRAVR